MADRSLTAEGCVGRLSLKTRTKTVMEILPEGAMTTMMMMIVKGQGLQFLQEIVTATVRCSMILAQEMMVCLLVCISYNVRISIIGKPIV